jgi:hypothetical protein
MQSESRCLRKRWSRFLRTLRLMGGGAAAGTAGYSATSGSLGSEPVSPPNDCSCRERERAEPESKRAQIVRGERLTLNSATFACVHERRSAPRVRAMTASAPELHGTQCWLLAAVFPQARAATRRLIAYLRTPGARRGVDGGVRSRARWRSGGVLRVPAHQVRPAANWSTDAAGVMMGARCRLKGLSTDDLATRA